MNVHTAENASKSDVSLPFFNLKSQIPEHERTRAIFLSRRGNCCESPESAEFMSKQQEVKTYVSHFPPLWKWRMPSLPSSLCPISPSVI